MPGGRHLGRGWFSLGRWFRAICGEDPAPAPPACDGVMSAEIAADAPQAPCTGAAGKNHAFCRRATK
jgi:hypothetical protein